MVKLDTKSEDYKTAMNAVERNVYKICMNGVADVVLSEIRDRLSIDKNLYSTLQKETDIDKIYNIDKFIQFLTDEWIKRSFSGEEEKKNLVEMLAKKEAMRELKKTKVGQAEINRIAKNISNSNIDHYLRRQIETYQLYSLFIIFPSRINMKIWKPVVDVRLFNIPPERILKFNRTIVEKHYLPRVTTSNGNIYIKINELTRKEDIGLIWESHVEKVKNRHREKYRYEHAPRKCKDYKTDMVILKLYNSGLKPKAISNCLYEDHEIKINPEQVSNRLKELRKQSNSEERKKIISLLCE